ncbi:MAG: P-loop NTPase, partial [Anaerolineae bacterium]|nr:P-loop NTPase [Anaerolineae bacterium]
MNPSSDLDFVFYLRLLRKWLWLLILFGVVAGGIAYISRSRQAAQYHAAAIVSIGGFMESPNPSSSEISISSELAETYVILASTRDLLGATIRNHNLPLTTEELQDILTVEAMRSTSLLRISVTTTDPLLAVDVANAVAEQLIVQSPTNLTPEQEEQVVLARAEIARLSSQLEDAREELEQQNVILDMALESPTVTTEEIDRLLTQRNILMEQINTASATIAQFQNTITEMQQRTNRLSIVEHAQVGDAIGTNILSSTLVGVIIGVSLALGIAYLVEYLDDTLRTAQDTTVALALPVLGAVNRFGRRRDNYTKRLVTVHDPGSPTAERYRVLRTNLMFSSSGKNGKGVYIVTSPGPSEGKSVTAANLAVAMAAAGLRVLLVDADLRRPVVHKIFGLSNELGLTTLLFADPADTGLPKEEALQWSGNMRECLQDTSVPRLRVITSGFVPNNPTEILGSALMQRWVNTFMAANNVDVIIFDSPPCLVV